MKRAIRLSRDQRGVAAVEMALSLPILVTMIYGVFQLGNLFEANAGMQHALGEGARYGNLCLSVTNGACTLPTGTAIADKVNSKLFGTKSGTWDAPSVTKTTATSGYVTVTVTYHQSLNFLFFRGPTVDVSRSKRVYLADTPPSQTDCAAAAAAHSSDPSKPAAAASCTIYS